MEQKFQLAKNYNYIHDMQQEAYIDVKDTVNHWCVGIIIDTDEEKNLVKIHFEGWTNRYDENLKKIKEIRELDFKYFQTPNELTQFLRGELYFYIDSLISLFTSTTTEDLPAILDFMQEVFRLIIRWMEIFPQYLKNFNEYQQQPNLFLVDQDTAISQCGNEFFDILEKCFGQCPRCLKFFQKFSTEVLYEGERQFVKADKVKQFGFMFSLYNSFGNMGGFERILEFINFEIKDPKQYFIRINHFYNRDNNIKGCPFQLTMKVLKPFVRILDQSEKTFVSQFTNDVKKTLLFRLDNLTENEIKELDKEILRDTIDILKNYMHFIDKENKYQIAELYELNIAHKYLKSPFFEKRIRGVNDLKDIFYKVENSTKSISTLENQQLEYTRWLNAEKYAQWIIQENIIQFIFIESPHVELIKRSYEILKLLARDEKWFTNEIVDMMWNCCKGKHEDIIRGTFELIQEIATFMPLDKIAYMFTKISSIKESEFDEKTVLFLKNYTLNAMKNIKITKKADPKMGNSVTNFLKGKKETKEERQFYDLNKFWLIFQDSNKVTPKVKDVALNSLVEILQEVNEKEIKEFFILQSCDNISKDETFLNSLIFLRKILNTYPLDSQIRFKPGTSVQAVSQILQDIFKKQDLFDQIFENTINYLKQAQTGKETKQQMVPFDKLHTIILTGNVTHEEFIKVIISFIEFVLTNSKITLTFEHIQRMFNMFVLNAVTEYESNTFFVFLTKENEQAKSKERRFLLDDQLRSDVFLKIFCNNQLLNCEKINVQGFICFRKLFLIVNEEEKALEVQREDRVVVNILNALQGIETLWIIAIQCQNKMVKDNCRDFLVDLYLRTKTKSNTQRKSITELFTGRCLQHFKNSHDKGDHQLNCLKLIKTFISRFDGEHIQEEDMSIYDPKEIRPVQITLNPDKLVNQVKIHPNQKIWQLKRKMADLFKMKLSEFYIKTKQGPLEEHIYDDQIKDYTIQTVCIQRVTIEEMEKEFPRYLIGYNSEYTNVFIELLKVGNEECKREVLSLLESLPINIEFKLYLSNNITAMAEPSINEWNKLFSWDGNELSQTVYFLMSLEDLMIPKREIANQETIQLEVQTKAEFCTRFISKGGFNYLYNLLSTLSKEQLEKDTLKTKVLIIIIRLIHHLFSIKQFQLLKPQLQETQIENLCQQALFVIDSFINTVKAQQDAQFSQQEERFTRVLKQDYHLLNYAFGFLFKAISCYQQSISILYNYTGIQDLFRSALIDIEQENIQKIAMSSIFDLCMKLELNQTLSMKPSFFFMKMFIQDFLDYSLEQKGQKSKIFFELITKLQNNTDVYQLIHLIIPIEQLVSNLCKIIIDRQIIEISARDEDISLSGIFIFLKSILDKFPEIRTNFKEKNTLLKYLIHDCLFHKETKGLLISKNKALPPKCKNINTRDNCLKLVNILCQNNEEGMYIFIRYLKNYIGETFWRTPRKTDWSISVHQQERSLTGFVGLRNIGCICYMNSIMQQLFMIPSFRKAVLEVEDIFQGKVLNEENVLHQIKMIFGSLMEVEKQYYNPKKFCQAFKDIDGSPIDPTVQRDVDEFFNMFMDRIENLIKGKREEKIIKNLFEGVFANEFICKGCPHYSEREEPFLAISLSIKNKHSIKESLDAFVEGEMLEGDNSYYCEKCEKKVNTLKRCCVKRMPNILILVLKRFEFNFDTMTKFKINDYCEFPMALNMMEYSQENLAKKDIIQQMEKQDLTVEELNEDQQLIFKKEIPSKYYQYNLKGTVIHAGTADQGHYYSFIQDRENPNGKWYEFNDTIVRDFDPSDIPHEAFGGEENSVLYNVPQGQNNDPAMIQAMKQFKTKIQNAYVLIYEREDYIDMEKFNEYMDNPNIYTNAQEMNYRYEQCKLSKVVSSQITIPPQIHDNILEMNKKFWLEKFIFNKTYIDSILNIFKDIPIIENKDYVKARDNELQNMQGGQFELFKFLTSFYLTTVVRAKERKAVPHFMKVIREALQKNIALSVWFTETFCNQDLIKEFLIDCPIPDMKRFIAGLLGTAIKSVYEFEGKQIFDYASLLETDQLQYIRQTQQQFIKQDRIIDNRLSPQPKSENFQSSCQEIQFISLQHHSQQLPILIILMNSFMHQAVSPHNLKNQELCGQFYMAISHMVELGEFSRLYLLKNKTVGRLLDLFLNSDNNKLAQPISLKFKSETLQQMPLILIDKELYIQSNLAKNNVPINPTERKLNIAQATNTNMFLLYTVSTLVRSCIFVKTQKKSPLANDDLNFKLDQDELELLINHQHESWWKNCDMKITRNAVSLMYAHISFENKEFSLQYLTTLMNNIQKAPTFDKLKYYERPLLKMLQIQDNYQSDRIKKVLTNLQDIMKNTTQYYKDMDSLIDMVYKVTLLNYNLLQIVSRCPQVVDMLNKNNQFYRLIEQWQKDNWHFPLNQQKVRIFKQGIIQWNNLKPNLINQPLLDKVASMNKERLQKLQKLIQKDLPTIETTYDSDDDMYHHNFQEKERVDFLDNMDIWNTGQIEIALEEMVKCISESQLNANGNPTTLWIETESDKLAPPNTQSTSDKRKMYRFYLDLLRNANQQQ